MHYGLCENGEWVSEKGNSWNFLDNIVVLRGQLVTQQTLQPETKKYCCVTTQLLLITNNVAEKVA